MDFTLSSVQCEIVFNTLARTTAAPHIRGMNYAQAARELREALLFIHTTRGDVLRGLMARACERRPTTINIPGLRYHLTAPLPICPGDRPLSVMCNGAWFSCDPNCIAVFIETRRP